MVQRAAASGPHVERFRDYLGLLARAHLSPRDPSKVEASDIVQQTLMEAHQKREQYRGQTDAELAGWLKEMLLHNLADALRRSGRAKRDVRRERSLEAAIEDSFSRADDWLAGQEASPSQQVIKIEQLLRLSAALAQLSGDQRDAVVLHHLQAYSLAQIAEQMQRSQPAVAGLLHRGLKHLRQLMDGEAET